MKAPKTSQPATMNMLTLKASSQFSPRPFQASDDQQREEKKENKTGLPDQLKAGIENLSGISLDDVRVHYKSEKPAQLKAHAYAQGNDIHIASGQEKYLPHEAWHVVQQAKGRVKPTMQMKEGVLVNDDEGLEIEADVMGRNAEHIRRSASSAIVRGPRATKAAQRTGNVSEAMNSPGVHIKASEEKRRLNFLSSDSIMPTPRSPLFRKRVDTHAEIVQARFILRSGARVRVDEPYTLQTGEEEINNPFKPLSTSGAMDNVLKYLSPADIAHLAATNFENSKSLMGVSDVALAREVAGGKPNKGTRSFNTKIDPKGARRKIDRLSEKRLMSTRAMNDLDAANKEKGEPLKGKGDSTSIKTQVDEGKSSLLSTSSTPQHKFSSGSSGHAGILTPTFYQAQSELAKRFPQTLSIDIAPEERAAHKSRYIPHEKVLQGVEGDERLTKRVVEAHEEMFRTPLPLEHVVWFEGGLPGGEFERSRAALDRAAERPEKEAKEEEQAVTNVMKWLKKDYKEAERIVRAVGGAKEVNSLGRKGLQKKWLKNDEEAQRIVPEERGANEVNNLGRKEQPKNKRK